MDKIIEIFSKVDVLGYIEKGYGIFHCEGDETVLEDITEFLERKALYDESTKLWCNGPSYIAELYLEEISKR